jgi:hypothetical protein
VKENQEWLSENKQRMFDGFHPTGKATGVKVTDVAVTWKGGSPGRQWEDVSAYTVRFALYWQGPVISDGHSEIEFVYDTAIERVTYCRLLRSNGITREDIGNAAGELAAELLRSWAEK